MQNLVQTVPRLTGMLNDEWLAPETFLEIDSTWIKNDTHILPLYCTSVQFKNCLASSWHITNPGPTEIQLIVLVATHLLIITKYFAA